MHLREHSEAVVRLTDEHRSQARSAPLRAAASPRFSRPHLAGFGGPSCRKSSASAPVCVPRPHLPKGGERSTCRASDGGRDVCRPKVCQMLPNLAGLLGGGIDADSCKYFFAAFFKISKICAFSCWLKAFLACLSSDAEQDFSADHGRFRRQSEAIVDGSGGWRTDGARRIDC